MTELISTESGEGPVATDGNSVRALFTDLVCERSGLQAELRFDACLREVVQKAKRFVFLEIYGFERTEILNLLLDQARRGLQIYLTVDPADEADPYEQPKLQLLADLRNRLRENADLAQRIQVGFLPLAPVVVEEVDEEVRVERFAQIDHHKVLVADDGDGGLCEVSGGINLGEHSNRNWDAAMSIGGPAAQEQLRTLVWLHELATSWSGEALTVAGWIKTEFLDRTMPSRGSTAVQVGRTGLRQLGGIKPDTTVEVVTASYEQLVREALESATEQILIACYAFTDVPFAGQNRYLFEVLREKQRRGVEVRVVVDALEIEGHLVNEGTVWRLADAGISIRYYEPGYAGDRVDGAKNQTKLHSKLAVIDGRTVLIGSANWSQNGFRFNMEAGKRVDDPGVAAAVRDAFFRPLWNVARQIKLPPTAKPEDCSGVPRVVPGDTAPLESEDHVYVVFDLETTGFAAETDRILQIAAVAGRLRDGGFAELKDGEFNRYCNPGISLAGLPRTIPEAVTKLTRITDAHVVDAEPCERVLLEFLEWLDGFDVPIVLVGHNVGYDCRMLRPNLRRVAAGYDLAHPLVDTLALSRKAVFTTATDGHQLKTVARRLGLEVPGDDKLHNALVDVRLTARVFAFLIKRGREQGLRLDTLASLDTYEARVVPYRVVEASGYAVQTKEEASLVDRYIAATADRWRLATRRSHFAAALAHADLQLQKAALARVPELAKGLAEVRFAAGGAALCVVSGEALTYLEGGHDIVRSVLEDNRLLDEVATPPRVTIQALDLLKARDRARWQEATSRYVETISGEKVDVRGHPRSLFIEFDRHERAWVATLYRSTDTEALVVPYMALHARVQQIDAALHNLGEEAVEREKAALVAYGAGVTERLRLWNGVGDSVSIGRRWTRKITDPEAVLQLLRDAGVAPLPTIALAAVSKILRRELVPQLPELARERIAAACRRVLSIKLS